MLQSVLANRDPHVTSTPPAGTGVDSSYAWMRLTAAVVLGTIGSVGMWSVPVALPAVQAEFGVARGDASLPFTLAMMGFAFGGVVMGRLSDRLGIVPPIAAGAVAVSLGYVAAGLAGNLWLFALAYALVGFGTSATFGPMMADLSQWFTRRRGIAVAIASSGNYIAGTIWPPVIEHFIAQRRLARDPYRHRHLLRARDRCRCCWRCGARRRRIRRASARPRSPRRARSASHPARCRGCCASPGSPAASPCRCRRCTSSPIAATSATDRRAAPRCCR